MSAEGTATEPSLGSQFTGAGAIFFIKKEDTIMTKRPVIGIPCTQSRDEWGGLALGNSETYLRAIEAAGGTPLL